MYIFPTFPLCAGFFAVFATLMKFDVLHERCSVSLGLWQQMQSLRDLVQSYVGKASFCRCACSTHFGGVQLLRSLTRGAAVLLLQAPLTPSGSSCSSNDLETSVCSKHQLQSCNTSVQVYPTSQCKRGLIILPCAYESKCQEEIRYRRLQVPCS